MKKIYKYDKFFEKELEHRGFQRINLDDNSGYWYEVFKPFPIFDEIKIGVEIDNNLLYFEVQDVEYSECASKNFIVKNIGDVDNLIKKFELD